MTETQNLTPETINDELSKTTWTATKRYQQGFSVYRDFADEHEQTTPILRSFATHLARAVTNSEDVKTPSTWVLTELGGGRGHYGKQIAWGIVDVTGPEIIEAGGAQFNILPVQYVPSDIFADSVGKAADRFQPLTAGGVPKHKKRFYHDVRRGAVGDFNDPSVREMIFEQNFKGSYDSTKGTEGPDLVTVCHSGYFIKDPKEFFTDLNNRMGPNSAIITPHGENTANKLAASAQEVGMEVQSLLPQEVHIDMFKLIGIDNVRDADERHKLMEEFWQAMRHPVPIPLNDNIPEVDSQSNPYKEHPQFLRGRFVIDFLSSAPLETLDELQREKTINKIKSGMREAEGILLAPCRIDVILPSRAAANSGYVQAVSKAITATQAEMRRRQQYGMGATGRELGD